jgi:hypothetical protein
MSIRSGSAIRCLVAASVAAILGISAQARAQPLPTARVIRDLGDGSYQVVVGTSDTLFTISDARMKDLLVLDADLRAARATITVHEQSIRTLTDFRRTADSNIAIKDRAITNLSERIDILTQEIELYKKLLRQANPWVSVSGGVGLTRDGLGLLAGFGVKRVRVWGTLQDEGSGIFAGYHLPLSIF